mgnify:CR=1 FL=1
MDSKLKLIVDSLGKDRFKFNEPLKDYTASGIGGSARLFFIATEDCCAITSPVNKDK